MEKNIEIYLVDKYDFIQKYNKKKISTDVIDYIIDQAILIGKKENIKIIINKKFEIEQDCSQMIKEGLKEEYNKSLKNHHVRDAKQVGFFILGIIFIFLSTLIEKQMLLKELLLITGWVPIWEMVKIELISDMEGRKRRVIIKKILESEIIVK